MTNLKNLMWQIKADKKTTFKEMANNIGKENKFLSVHLKNDSIRVSDLKKCLNCVGVPLVILYDGKKYTI